MRRKVLDTNHLINHWHDARRASGKRLEEVTPQEAAAWGRGLVLLRKAAAILTPVQLEFLCGTRSQHETALADAFLSSFVLADEGQVLSEDWQRAQRIARRVPRPAARRQALDCVILAICTRLRMDLDTTDLRQPRQL